MGRGWNGDNLPSQPKGPGSAVYAHAHSLKRRSHQWSDVAVKLSGKTEGCKLKEKTKEKELKMERRKKQGEES